MRGQIEGHFEFDGSNTSQKVGTWPLCSIHSSSSSLQPINICGDLQLDLLEMTVVPFLSDMSFNPRSSLKMTSSRWEHVLF